MLFQLLFFSVKLKDLLKKNNQNYVVLYSDNSQDMVLLALIYFGVQNSMIQKGQNLIHTHDIVIVHISVLL